MDVEDEIDREDFHTGVEAGEVDETDELDEEERRLAAGLPSLPIEAPRGDKAVSVCVPFLSGYYLIISQIVKPNTTRVWEYVSDASVGGGIGSEGGYWSDDNGVRISLTEDNDNTDANLRWMSRLWNPRLHD